MADCTRRTYLPMFFVAMY